MVKLKKGFKTIVKQIKKQNAPRQRRQQGEQDYSGHEAMLHGLVDPFCAEAANARYPDQGAGKTLTFQQRFTIPLTTDASGGFAYAINPKIDFITLPSASYALSVATWGANWTTSAATNLVNVYAQNYRPTSLGVKLSNSLSATNSSGYLILAKGGPAIRSGTTTFDPSNFSSYTLYPNEHGGEWHIQSHPRSSNAYDFKQPGDYNSATTPADDTWETIFISGTNLPISTTGALIMEIYANYEYSVIEDAPIAQLALLQPVLNVPMQTAVNHVQSAHPPSHKGGSHIVKAFVKKEAKKALLKHVLPFAAKKATQLLL